MGRVVLHNCTGAVGSASHSLHGLHFYLLYYEKKKLLSQMCIVHAQSSNLFTLRSNIDSVFPDILPYREDNVCAPSWIAILTPRPSASHASCYATISFVCFRSFFFLSFCSFIFFINKLIFSLTELDLFCVCIHRNDDSYIAVFFFHQ